MEHNDDRFHRRKHPRMRHYDYAQPGYYFVTICTKDNKCLFGEPGQLNRLGKLAQQGLAEIEQHTQGVLMDKCVVMPNHIHAIIILSENATELPTVIGQYKSAVTRNIRKISSVTEVWQTSFHDHVIRSEEAYRRIWAYIDTNPVRWKDDCFYVELPHDLNKEKIRTWSAGS